MNADNKNLAYLLKIKFGLSPYEPTEDQIRSIKAAIRSIEYQKGTPSEGDWKDIVYRYCPGAGTHRYLGEDTSDLITLLMLAKKPD